MILPGSVRRGIAKKSGACSGAPGVHANELADPRENFIHGVARGGTPFYRRCIPLVQEFCQTLSGAGEPALHRAHRRSYLLGGLAVRIPASSYEEQGFALLVRKGLHR